MSADSDQTNPVLETKAVYSPPVHAATVATLQRVEQPLAQLSDEHD